MMFVSRFLLATVFCAFCCSAHAQVDGFVNIITTPGSTHNYHLDRLTVIHYDKPEPSDALSNELLDNKRMLEGTPSADLLLLLTNTTLEVYNNDQTSHQTDWIVSLQLRPGCVPWYLQESSVPDSGTFYIKYQGNCGYSQVFYNFDSDIFEPEAPYIHLGGRGIIVGTKDEEDFEVHISSDSQHLELQTVAQRYPSRILANQIHDCILLHDLYPLDPLEQETVYFTIVCTVAGGGTKHHHVAYRYRAYPLNITVNVLSMGVPITAPAGGYIAVRDDSSLSLYDATNLHQQPPGFYDKFPNIKQVNFEIFANRTWLIVQLEHSNLFAIDVDIFILSRGVDGVFELPETNIGSCLPVCLPITHTDDELIVFSDDSNGYSSVVFSMVSGMPEETVRTTRILGRPFVAVFISDPNTSLSITTMHEVIIEPPKFNTEVLTKIVAPSVVVGVLVMLLATVTIVIVLRRSPRCSHKKHLLVPSESGSSLELNDIIIVQGPKAKSTVVNNPLPGNQQPPNIPIPDHIDETTLVNPVEVMNHPIQETDDGAADTRSLQMNQVAQPSAP